jgi:hypothetical protein
MLAAMADRATWAKRVDAWRASGLTAAVFAERGGFSEKTLRYWAWRLGREARAFVRVVRETPTATAAPIVVELGDVRVLVPPGFDRAALRNVLAALRAPEDAS